MPTAKNTITAFPSSGGRPHRRAFELEEDSDLQLYLNDIYKLPKGVSDDEEKRLAARIQAGDEAAVEELVISNLPLAVAIAKHYRSRGLSLLDLIQTANIGLLRAARKFDPSRGRFATCAYPWMRQELSREYPRLMRTIQIPAYVNLKLQTFRREKRLLTNQQGVDPTPGELAKALSLPLKEVQQLLQLEEGVLSLDIPDAIPEILDTTFQTPEEAMEEEMLREELAIFLESLARTRTEVNQKRLQVLLMRYGLGPYAGEEPYTQKAISLKLGVKQQRVQQLEKEAYIEIRRRNNLP